MMLSKLRRRVPIVRQLAMSECGAACLCMAVRYYGSECSLETCRNLVSVGRDGVTAESIVQAARHLGFIVRAYSASLSDLRTLPTPSILHWKFRHFVVLESINDKGAWIVDPACGRVRVPMEDLDRFFTGVVLTLRPGLEFSRKIAGQKRHPWSDYLHWLVPERRILGLLCQLTVASLLIQAFTLLPAGATKLLLDVLLPARVQGTLAVFGWGILFMTISLITTLLLRSSLLTYLRGQADLHLTTSFFHHIFRLPFSFFQQRSAGDLLLRVRSNSSIRELMTNQAMSAVLDGIMVLTTLTLVLKMVPIFAFIALGMGLTEIILTIGAAAPMKRLVQEELATASEEQNCAVETLSNIAYVKASGSNVQAFERWLDLFLKQLKASLQRAYFSSAVESLASSMRTIGPMALLWVGTREALNGRLSVGTVFAASSLTMSLVTPFGNAIGVVRQWPALKAHFERVFDVLDADTEQLSSTSDIPQGVLASIEVQNLSFRYNASSPWILRNVSFAIRPGEKVAVVGPTGCGKSTLLRLLLGLHPATEGCILFNGKPLESYDYDKLRAQWGVVLQDSSIFTGSIRDNVTLARNNATLDDVIEACRIAELDGEVSRMPMAYETMVSPASTLSGGQTQRLAIARAVLGKPTLLLFDEATSHLDTATEEAVYANLATLCNTKLIIAHRLSTIRDSDRILVMTDGSIIEQGHHDSLLRNEGPYARLVEAQQL